MSNTAKQNELVERLTTLSMKSPQAHPNVEINLKYHDNDGVRQVLAHLCVKLM